MCCSKGHSFATNEGSKFIKVNQGEEAAMRLTIVLNV
jgi:hypothetical protein